MRSEVKETYSNLKKNGFERGTISAMAESIMRNLSISTDSNHYMDMDDFEDKIMTHVEELLEEAIPELIGDGYEELMKKSALELGRILYELDNRGCLENDAEKAYYCPVFFGEDAKRCFDRLLLAYIRINYVKKEELS